ncbi:MAG: PDZ domain-containing protein [Bacteroidetes bacterium]|nr:PDZ domain-containing protein [Bacteroidota bacterium]
MNKHLLKLSGLAALALLLQTPSFAQPRDKGLKKDTAIDRLSGYDEIIIKRKSDKDTKVTVEIKNGEVFIDGKPASEFHDDDIAVRKHRVRVMDGRTFSFSTDGGDIAFPEPPEPGGAPLPPGSPFRNGGGWNYDVAPRKAVANSAFLGVTTEKSSEGDGAKIKAVSDSSAAAKAGLKEGDIIFKVGDEVVDNPDELSAAIRKHKPQEKVTIEYYRDGKKQQTTAVLGKGTQQYRSFMYRTPDGQSFNYKLDDLNDQIWKYNDDFNRSFGFKGGSRLGIRAQDTEEGKGVKVLDVDDESNAEKAGIKEGDIITKFDGKEINSTTELVSAAQAAKGKPSVHVNLLRGGKSVEVDIKTPKKLKTANL